MLVFAIVVSICTALFLLSPFLFGKGGHLQAAASINSPERLEAIKSSILKRFLEDERAYTEKRINKLAWEQRRAYLTNRYIDAARRLDYLNHLLLEQNQSNRGH